MKSSDFLSVFWSPFAFVLATLLGVLTWALFFLEFFGIAIPLTSSLVIGAGVFVISYLVVALAMNSFKSLEDYSDYD